MERGGTLTHGPSAVAVAHQQAADRSAAGARLATTYCRWGNPLTTRRGDRDYSLRTDKSTWAKTLFEEVGVEAKPRHQVRPAGFCASGKGVDERGSLTRIKRARVTQRRVHRDWSSRRIREQRRKRRRTRRTQIAECGRVRSRGRPARRRPPRRLSVLRISKRRSLIF